MPSVADGSAVVARNKGGRPKGTRNPTTMWRDEVMKAVCRLRSGDDRKKYKVLRLLAEKLMDRALDGDMTAMREIADRLDGKAVQSVQVDKNIQVTHIEHSIVDMPKLVEAGEIEVIEDKDATGDGESDEDVHDTEQALTR